MFALSLYSDWEDSRENRQRYPKKTLKGQLNKFLGIEFGKTLESQKIKILGEHELGESFEYPGTAVRGHRELYDYSEYFPAVEIELPKVFRKFKRGWVFLAPTSKRVVAMHFLTDKDENLTRKDANYEMLRSFSLIVGANSQIGNKLESDIGNTFLRFCAKTCGENAVENQKSYRYEKRNNVCISVGARERQLDCLALFNIKEDALQVEASV